LCGGTEENYEVFRMVGFTTEIGTGPTITRVRSCNTGANFLGVFEIINLVRIDQAVDKASDPLVRQFVRVMVALSGMAVAFPWSL
jgi:hypothetical protein